MHLFWEHFAPFFPQMGNIVALIWGAFCPFFPQIGNVAALIGSSYPHGICLIFGSICGKLDAKLASFFWKILYKFGHKMLKKLDRRDACGRWPNVQYLRYWHLNLMWMHIFVYFTFYILHLEVDHPVCVSFFPRVFYISFILAIKKTKNGLNRGFLKRWEKILSIIHQTCQKSVLLLPPTVRSAVIVTIHSKTFFLLQCVAKWKFGYAILEIPFFTKLSWLVKKILYYFSKDLLV